MAPRETTCQFQSLDNTLTHQVNKTLIRLQFILQLTQSSAAMAPFRVIIVGGSIAGLALANMLEQYDIDFTVLEKHEKIAPQLGAGLALLPHGSRILDQLGCYDVMEKLSMSVNSLSGYDDNGKRCIHLPGLGAWMEKT